MFAFAKVVYRQGRKTPNGYEGRYVLRMGKAGRGKEIAAVTYWPWSPKSIESAQRTINTAARRAGVEIIWPER